MREKVFVLAVQDDPEGVLYQVLVHFRAPHGEGCLECDKDLAHDDKHEDAENVGAENDYFNASEIAQVLDVDFIVEVACAFLDVIAEVNVALHNNVDDRAHVDHEVEGHEYRLHKKSINLVVSDSLLREDQG